MKRLLTLALLSFCMAAGAQSPWTFASTALTIGKWITSDSKKTYYIRVRSEGATVEEARENGNKYAILQSTGEVIVSEKELTDDKLRSNVINYSSGYIDKVRDVGEATKEGNKYIVVQDIWVSGSKIADRALILGEVKENTLNDSEKTASLRSLQATIKSSSTRSKNAKEIIDGILADYHRMAYNARVIGWEFGNASYRRPYYGLTTSQSFIVKAKITNKFEVKEKDKKPWFVALEEAIKTTNEEGYHNEKWSVHLGWPIFGTRAGWADKSIQENIIRTFDPGNTQVMVKFIGATNPQAACYDLSDKHFEGSLGYDKKPNGWDERVYQIPSSFNYETNFILPRREDQSEDQFIQWVQSVKGVEIEFVNPSKCRVRS